MAEASSQPVASEASSNQSVPTEQVSAIDQQPSSLEASGQCLTGQKRTGKEEASAAESVEHEGGAVKKRKLTKKERKAQKLLKQMAQLGYKGSGELELKPSNEEQEEAAAQKKAEEEKKAAEESYTQSLREARALAAQWARYPGMSGPDKDKDFKSFVHAKAKQKETVEKPFPDAPETWFNSSEPQREPSKWKRQPPKASQTQEQPENNEEEEENTWYRKKWGQKTGRDYGGNMLLDDLYITNAGRGT
eukprot:g640.t1